MMYLTIYACTAQFDICSFIFDHHGKRFFRCMSKIYGRERAKRIQAAENFNVDKPPSKRRRVPYWKPIEPDSSQSDTVSTSSGADEKCPYFERSQKITPHALVHLADQVVMGGTHSFHNTSAQESSHKQCIAHAALRSRTYHDHNNRSSQTMLEYLIGRRQMQKIVEFATKGMSTGVGVVIICLHDTSLGYVICYVVDICHQYMSSNPQVQVKYLPHRMTSWLVISL